MVTLCLASVSYIIFVGDIYSNRRAHTIQKEDCKTPERKKVRAIIYTYTLLTLFCSFLLDRLLKYERVSSDSDSSPSPLSSEEDERPRKIVKKEPPGPGECNDITTTYLYVLTIF